MKKLLIPILLVLGAEAVVAEFSIDWFKAAGGGGASTGSGFAVTGTIGQTDTGQMTGASSAWLADFGA